MKRALLACLLPLLLAACGYHLAGHGGEHGAIPADVRVVALTGAGEAQRYMPLMKSRLSAAGYTVAARAAEGEAGAVIRLTHSSEQFVPSAYDQSGIATQYRMILVGSVDVEQQGKVIWRSGPVTVQDEVYVTGSLASIEASRQRLKEDLAREWVRRAWSRLRSGF